MTTIMKNIFVTLYLIVLFPSFTFAQSTLSPQMQKAYEYYDNRDFVNALKIFLEEAEKGDTIAYVCVAVIYANGEGVSQDKTEAAKWYRKAAEQGNANAQFNLGILYDNGEGVNQDKTEAAKWYRKAAEQGNANAQFNLGIVYDNGEGVSQDKTEAAKWYRKAAEQGNANAQNNLGILYEEGLGVQMNSNEAYKWLKKAAENGHNIALCNLGFYYDNGIVVDKDAQKAFSLYKQAAENGYNRAQRKLALCYFYGNGTRKDNNLAIYWITKAKDNGDESAREILVEMKKNMNLAKTGEYDNSLSKTVIMNKRNGVYYIPCKINGIGADFIFDTGAGRVSLSSSFAMLLINKGLLSDNDYRGKINTRIADGSLNEAYDVNIRDVEIGGLHLYNVRAIIKKQQNAPLLLGQSVIERLGKITIEGCRLIIHK